jgi:lipopolysaccharide export system protein LptA
VTPRPVAGIVLALGLLLAGGPAFTQQLDLTHGGPIDITARDGIEWRQAERQVIARGDAKAIRGAVTVQADRLTAWYRKKAAGPDGDQKAPAAQQASIGIGSDPGSEGNEIYRLQADGNVRIYTQTDKAVGDRATYDLDNAVLVLTGRNLTLTTPNDVLTARDDLEYWPQKHMAVARGNAVVVTNDAKRVAADTLVAYTKDAPNPPAGAGATAPQQAAKPGQNDDPLASSGKVERVEAFGNVSIRTPTDMVTGDRGVYVPDTGMARLAGTVRITRGQNQLNGAEAEVNMKTGIAKLLAAPKSRVSGLVLPNDQSNKSLEHDPVAKAGSAAAPGSQAAPATTGGAQP